jgi:ABC-2 type transport system permease protein
MSAPPSHLGALRELWIRTGAIAHKELLHFLRDYQAIYLALGMPLVLVVIFGYAVTFDLEDARLAVLDQDRSPASRRLVEALDASDAFRVDLALERATDAEALFRRDRVKAMVVIPRGFARTLARGETGEVQLLLDGADGTLARTTLGYAAGLTQAQTLALLREAGLGATLPLEARVRTWYNPQMRSALFIVPGLVALVLTILAVLLTALTVAREWERGSMEQLFSTPVGRLPVVLGKLAPYLAIGFLQMLLVLVAGAYLFDMPMRGSFALLVLATALFLLCVLGQGLLISVITRNQQVATQVGAVSALLPSLLLSGFLFPIENMPWFLRAIARVVPARYLITCLRGILLQGRGLAELWPDFLALALLGTLIVAASTARFRRRLD